MSEMLGRFVNRTRVRSPIYYLGSVWGSVTAIALASWAFDPVGATEIVGILASALLIGSVTGELAYREAYLRNFGGESDGE